MDRRTFLAGIGAGAVVPTLPAAADVHGAVKMIAAPTGVAAASTNAAWHTLYYQWVNDALHERGGYIKCWVDGVEVKEGDNPLEGVPLELAHYVDINDWEGDEDEGFRVGIRVREAAVLG